MKTEPEAIESSLSSLGRQETQNAQILDSLASTAYLPQGYQWRYCPMQFHVRFTLPEAPDVNLAAEIGMTGFFSNVRAPIPPETDMDVLKHDLTEHLVSEGIVTADRRGDLQFEFR